MCLPPRAGEYADFPEGLSEELKTALSERGFRNLYSHQAEAFQRAKAGEDMIVVTPTASGKTLCYNLPVLDAIDEDRTSRALYLFPTKALAQDQLAEFEGLVRGLKAAVKAYTYDGDTPGDIRRAIRKKAHVVITNPDMLHAGILPHHTKWNEFFRNLSFVVIDETHTYRGVFGSHMVNVMRRLHRVCRHYGSTPQFICCSATIANPQEVANRLVEREVHAHRPERCAPGREAILFRQPAGGTEGTRVADVTPFDGPADCGRVSPERDLHDRLHHHKAQRRGPDKIPEGPVPEARNGRGAERYGDTGAGTCPT